MFCTECGGELHESYAPIDAVVRGVSTRVDGVRHYQCDSCDNYMVDPDAANELASKQLDQVFKAKGLLSPTEIKSIRKSLGFTQTEFEKALGVTSPTCSRWEHGVMLQSKQADMLMRLMACAPEVIVRVFGRGHKAVDIHIKAGVKRGNGTRRAIEKKAVVS